MVLVSTGYIYSCQATGNCLNLNLNLSSDEILFHLNVFPLIFLNP